MGFGVVLTAWISVLHTTVLSMMIRKHPALSRLLESYSSQFLLGMVMGVTLMMSALMLIMSLYFGHAAALCKSVDLAADAAKIADYECYTKHHFAMRMVSFFGANLAWGNGLLASMFLSGEDLGLMEWSSHQYESLESTASSGGQSYQSTPHV